MNAETKYETRPLESWRLARQIQENYNRRAWGPRQDGTLLVAMYDYGNLASILAGLGPHEYLNLGLLSAQIAVSRELTLNCAEASESRGYARDMCAATRINCGSVFCETTPYGKYPRPDFFIQLSYCDSMGKCAQVCQEHWDIPCFGIDYPLNLTQPVKPSHIDYFVTQLHDAIEWMEKVTGRTYQDELLIEAVKNEFRTSALWAKIWMLNRTVPAPLSQRMLLSLSFAPLALAHTAETVSFCRTLHDEVEFRVQKGIAALATERCRLVHEGIPPYYFLNIFKYVEQFGAVFVASFNDLTTRTGAFTVRDDGTWDIAPTPEERGARLDTRDDALRALAEWYLRSRNLCGLWGVMNVNELLGVVDGWHIDGVVMHANRGCIRLAAGLAEAKRGLQARGIPNMMYEANFLDPRDFSETQVIGQMDTFMESLGLSMIN